MADDGDAELIDRVIARDREAIRRLVENNQAWLLRLARTVAKDPELARDVVQDGWIAIFRALGTFERRSSLRTWMARIVINRAMTLAGRAARSVHFDAAAEDTGSSRFGPSGFWREPPPSWRSRGADELLARRQLRELALRAIDDLQEGQRIVVTLRDLEGWESYEVCNALGISESNQRVLLHRGRSAVRAALEKTMESGGAT